MTPGSLEESCQAACPELAEWLMTRAAVIQVTCGISLSGEVKEYSDPPEWEFAEDIVRLVAPLDHWSVRWAQVGWRFPEMEDMFKEIYVKTQQGICRTEVRE